MKKLVILFLSFVCGMTILASAQQDSSSTANDSAVRDSAASVSVNTVATDNTPVATQETTDETQTIAARRLWAACGLSLLVAVVALVVARNSGRRNKALIKALQQDLDKLKNELADTKAALDNLHKTSNVPHIPLPKPQPHPSTTHAAVTKPKPVTPATPVPRQLYLPKPDANGSFPRATATFENGNTMFVLTTTDGTNGTFVVVDDPKMQLLALMMPTENLTTACTGHNIQTSNGSNRIVTDTAGTATLINGRWHIKTQATIHYEA